MSSARRSDARQAGLLAAGDIPPAAVQVRPRACGMTTELADASLATRARCNVFWQQGVQRAVDALAADDLDRPESALEPVPSLLRDANRRDVARADRQLQPLEAETCESPQREKAHRLGRDPAPACSRRDDVRNLVSVSAASGVLTKRRISPRKAPSLPTMDRRRSRPARRLDSRSRTRLSPSGAGSAFTHSAVSACSRISRAMG